MLRISSAIQEVFSRHSLEEFVRRVRARLRASYPAQTSGLTDAALDALTRAAIERAPRYGMGSEHAVCRFTELLLVAGADVDARPAARAALERDDLDADDRLAAVLALYPPLALAEEPR